VIHGTRRHAIGRNAMAAAAKRTVPGAASFLPSDHSVIRRPFAGHDAGRRRRQAGCFWTPPPTENVMDHYIPKRRIPVTLWTEELHGVAGQIFLDLDATGNRHPTILETLNRATPFFPIAVGEDGRIHLVNRRKLARVTPARHVIPSDIFARGFEPWREEPADLLLADGARLSGRVQIPLQRETERLSDFLNRLGDGFFVLTTTAGAHLVAANAVVEVQISESAGSPIAAEAASEF